MKQKIKDIAIFLMMNNGDTNKKLRVLCLRYDKDIRFFRR